jgi:hypothetical protein
MPEDLSLTNLFSPSTKTQVLSEVKTKKKSEHHRDCPQSGRLEKVKAQEKAQAKEKEPETPFHLHE